MKRSTLIKISAAAAAAVLSVSALSAGDFAYTASYEDDVASLEERRAELSEKRQKLEDELNGYLEGAETQAEYLKLYNEKMELQEEEMNNLTSQIKAIDKKMKELDVKIEKKQEEVDAGIEAFRERLRAMYISGNDTIAEVFSGSSSFYDILARMEMVQRVSKHDNDMISELSGKVQELNDDKTALEDQRSMLDERKTEQVAVLEKLRETYANHEETKKWYEDQAAAQAVLTDEMIEQENAAEEELQAFIRKQQEEVAERMAEKRKKQEEKRKAKEEEKKRREEEQRKLEEEQRKKDEEEAAKKAAETAAETEAQPDPQADDHAVPSQRAAEDDYDVYSPDEDDDDFGDVTTAAADEDETPNAREDDPYNNYEFGKVYYSGEDEEEDDDKGYGTSSDTGFIWPVPTVRNITDGYGYRYVSEEGSSSNHKGIDINKPNCSGEAIVASAGGVVITASNTGNGYGIHVVIDHGDGISTLYGHMSSAAVSVGDEVQQGQTIGYIGNTGYAYGYHCHFEVRINGQHTDPLKYVSMDE